jgi:L-iditol 2-dehydrogenase
MRVAVYHNNSDIRIEERDKPTINYGEILVKAKFCGICGTDVMEWYRTQKGPRVMGHEMVGEIVESKTDKYKIGSSVFVSHHVPCDECKYCLEGNHTACNTLHTGNFDPGGFSEFIRVPTINVKKGVYVLDGLSYEEGTMIEPLACCIRGQRVVDVKEGQTVLILGSGITGLLNIQVAKNIGAKVIATDVNSNRLEIAKKFGADEVYLANDVPSIKVDRVIVCAGVASAYATAFESIEKSGKILAFAIPSKDLVLPTLQFWRNELTLVSSYGAAHVDLDESFQLIKDKKVDVASMITHKVKLEDIEKGFDLVVNPENSLKVLVEL